MAGLGCLCCPGHCQVILPPSLRLINISDSASSYLGLIKAFFNSSMDRFMRSCSFFFSESLVIWVKSCSFTLNGLATSYFSHRVACFLEQILGILELKSEIASDQNSIIFCFYIMYVLGAFSDWEWRLRREHNLRHLSSYSSILHLSGDWGEWRRVTCGDVATVGM